MQRLAGDFFVKRSVAIALEGGNIMELYELPNGQWQFGKGRDSVVVTSLDELPLLADGKPAVDPGTRQAIAAWLERTKHQPTPVAVQQGQTPLLAGDSVRDQLSQALSVMPDEAVARLLNAVQQVMGPIADSLKQGAQVNSHSDGYGQDQHVPTPGMAHVPSFQLPTGARWADPGNHAGGYLTHTGALDDKGIPLMQWHPSPDFHAITDQADPVPIAEPASDQVADEMAKDRRAHSAEDLVGAGGRSSRRRK